MRSLGERERNMTVTTGSFRFSDAPMQRDRTAGWRFVRQAGEVFQDIDGTWYLTSLDAVRGTAERAVRDIGRETRKLLGNR